MRPIRYQQIAEDLRNRLAHRDFTDGGVLPSEAELSSQYEASRVTIRRALELLRAEGLVESRQGFGWSVCAEPLRADLSRLATIDAQLAAAGRNSERRIVSFGFVDAPDRVRGLLAEKTVLEVERVHLADSSPIARVTVWCPETLGAALSRDDVAGSSFLEQLPVELGGATQTIGAAAVDDRDAELLE
ncbi:MAG: GntR family transcriptional regulator, partial [Microthrixaceae bacterium]